MFPSRYSWGDSTELFFEAFVSTNFERVWVDYPSRHLAKLPYTHLNYGFAAKKALDALLQANVEGQAVWVLPNKVQPVSLEWLEREAKYAPERYEEGGILPSFRSARRNGKSFSKSDFQRAVDDGMRWALKAVSEEPPPIYIPPERLREIYERALQAENPRHFTTVTIRNDIITMLRRIRTRERKAEQAAVEAQITHAHVKHHEKMEREFERLYDLLDRELEGIHRKSHLEGVDMLRKFFFTRYSPLSSTELRALYPNVAEAARHKRCQRARALLERAGASDELLAYITARGVSRPRAPRAHKSFQRRRES